MSSESKCNACDDPQCDAREQRPGEQEEAFLDRQALSRRMCQIEHKIMVLSGKGGVGKSTVAVNLACALALAGKHVGLLDVDIHGPSVPRLLNIEGVPVSGSGTTIDPVKVGCRPGLLSVMSIGLLCAAEDAVIWRGPRKFGAIKQFLKDVEWGKLDYLVVDSPPGTGDEPLAVAQLIGNADGAVVVTTPQQLAVQDVRRCVVFCRQLNLAVLGVVENMSGFVCPNCGERVDIFGAEGGRILAEDMGVPYLGSIPIDPAAVTSGDSGRPMVQTSPHSVMAMAFGRIVRQLLESELQPIEAARRPLEKGKTVRIAIPVTQGNLSTHFGHCEQFALFEVDAEAASVPDPRLLAPPAHEPGVLPRWLHEQGADVIITGGMGARAQTLFAQNNITVVLGAPAENPAQIVRSYLDGSLQTGANFCDH